MSRGAWLTASTGLFLSLGCANEVTIRLLSGDASAEGGPGMDSSAGCEGDAGYRALVLCDQPAAYWRFGERGPPSAFDQVDGGPVGTYDPGGKGGIQYGAPGAIAGDPDTAIHVNGTTMVTAGTALAFPGTAAFSLEAWVKPDVVDTNYRAIVSSVAWVNGQFRVGYALWSHTTGVGAERYSGTAAVQKAVYQTALPTNAYTHVVATYDGGTLSVYENGTLTVALLMQLSVDIMQAPLQIGNETAVPFPPWVGNLDEVAVYAHALSAAQVTEHYRVGSGQ
jgi:hypothetical protein